METGELIAILREVRDRVRSEYPEPTTAAGSEAPRLPIADLLPIVHARDAALGKVAAIGTVNPRPGGPVNAIVQGWKRMVARVLDWHVRDQVEFNRRVITAVDAAIEAMNQNNRALLEVAKHLGAQEKRQAGIEETFVETFRGEVQQLKDIRSHWAEWRLDWEHKIAQNEIQFLRSVADLQGAFQHRATLMDSNYRDSMHAQHAEFTAALERNAVEMQKRMWADFERIRLEYERLIHSELRTARQRAIATPPAVSPQPQAAAESIANLDYTHFAERFRGSEEYVRTGQQQYVPLFRECRNVLDIGCGRGEFLQLMREAGIPARGIDLGEESIALCRHKGLDAERADLFEYLAGLPEAALDGIFCAQLVEHLPPERLPEMVKLCASRLSRNGVILIETPNPECLAILATHFYLDPTHTRPVPPSLLAFYLEESGVGNLEVTRLAPAVESVPALAGLPEDLRESLFGYLDYSIRGIKL